MFRKISKFIKERKIASGIILIVLIVGAYFGFKALKGSTAVTRYVLASVQKGTIIASITGSGQVSASNQVDVKPKASGDVVYVSIKNGQEVKAGTLLVQLDTSDAQKTVRDAEINLEREQLALDKLNGVTTTDGTIRGTKEKAGDDMAKAREDGFNTVANIFLQLPDTMNGLDDMLFSYNFDKSQQNITYYVNSIRSYDSDKARQYENDVTDKYKIAREQYDKNLQDYKSASRFSQAETINSLIDETYETTKSIAEAIKSINNLIQLYRDQLIQRGLRAQSLSATHVSSLNTYTGQTNNYLLNLLSIKTTIQNSEETIVNAGFDIADQRIQVETAQENLAEARKKLNDYFVRAPFGGTITNVADIEKGDTISTATTVATLLTKQKIAEISLNEVDVAKIKVGQKTTLTFDAVEGLTITGEVLEADTIGTITQGVVNYTIKIGFDTQDDRIKSGMTVSASIITDTKQDVLLVPNSAIKSLGNISYVEVPNEKVVIDAATANTGVVLATVPGQQQIQIGLANDSYTEVTSGLQEGDEIISRTISATTTTSTSSTSGNTFRIPSGGANFR